MSGYSTVALVHRLEREVAELGFEMRNPAGTWGAEYENRVVLCPRSENQTIYADSAEVYRGSLEQLDSWLSGIRYAREYDAMLFGKNHNANRSKRVDRIVQDRKNKQLMNTLKEQQ